MGYIGSDPVRNDSVSTAQLADDAVTNPKIVDDIAFSNVTASNHISASGTGSFGGGIDADGTNSLFGYITASGIIFDATKTLVFGNIGKKYKED